MSIAISGSTITFADLTTQTTAALNAPSTPGFRNRIINGDMRIDQRNAGASVTATGNPFTVDRWRAVISQAAKFTVQQNAGSVTSAVGFVNYLGATSSSAYSITSSDYFILRQVIEGFNVADLAWGTASAATVTLSFRVYSSLTGTFGGSLQNYNQNRSYPFSYSIPTANTWTTINVTIAGDTTGTWDKNNTGGIIVDFGLGVGSTYSTTAGAWASGTYIAPTGAVSVVGTNGATFYITGLQLEKGSTATEFERRPIGAELALCQRYYQKTYELGVAPGTSTDVGAINYIATGGFQDLNDRLMVEMRSVPSTVSIITPTGVTGSVRNYTNSTNYVATINGGFGRTSSKQTVFRTNVPATTANELSYHLTADAEL